MKKKLAILAATAATMLAVSAAPALADDLDFDGFDDGFFIADDGFAFGDFEQEAESGDVDLSFDVSNSGDYASQSVPAIQFGNTGNFNNAPSFVQFDSTADDFESGGIEFSVSPSLGSESSHTVRQSSATRR